MLACLRRIGLTIAALSVCAPLRAQTAIQPFSLDTAASIDFFRGDNVNDRPQIIVDILATARLGKGWQAYVRPWFRLPRPNTPAPAALPWDVHIYQAKLQYEHSRPNSTR